MFTRAAARVTAPPPPVRRRARPLHTALLGCVLALLAALSLSAPPQASAATLREVTNFGSNPSNLRMHLYVPDNVRPQPAVLVAIHYCTGSGPAFYSGTEFARLADRYGFLVVYPSATRSGQCFDVSSPQALRRDGGSDPVGIRSMVQYVRANNGADPNRTFVTGASSGAMMTNVMLGNYPDVFKAGAAFMGVPHSCFATTDGSGWNSACANGQIIRTPQQWGDLVRGAYPGYAGARPRMQVWHGTNDTTLRYPNFQEEIKQWTDVHGLSQTPSMTDSPQSGWTRTRYGGTGEQAPVEAVSLQGVGHSLPMSGMAERAIAFFGLNG
ncbi:alpha/beta hydrolase family esterase [Streptomyces sp. MAR4 CNY-716]